MPSHIVKEKTYRKADLLKVAKNEVGDNFTLDELIYKLVLLDKINQGLDDVANGRVYTTEEVKAKLTKWHK
ncbi:MAG: hypothetical protein M0D57_21735 [Sphingobacteriales bacterium JAD_PAG50586_3]|nr:MAG: hypothetical protein M0D57_21735 [Sphingobacteriales bacterium JAD_PAG50586_3]